MLLCLLCLCQWHVIVLLIYLLLNAGAQGPRDLLDNKESRAHAVGVRSAGVARIAIVIDKAEGRR